MKRTALLVAVLLIVLGPVGGARVKLTTWTRTARRVSGKAGVPMSSRALLPVVAGDLSQDLGHGSLDLQVLLHLP